MLILKTFKLGSRGLSTYSTKKHSSMCKLASKQLHNKKNMLVSRQQRHLSRKEIPLMAKLLPRYLAYCTDYCVTPQRQTGSTPTPNLVQMLKCDASKRTLMPYPVHKHHEPQAIYCSLFSSSLDPHGNLPCILQNASS